MEDGGSLGFPAHPGGGCRIGFGEMNRVRRSQPCEPGRIVRSRVRIPTNPRGAGPRPNRTGAPRVRLAANGSQGIAALAPEAGRHRRREFAPQETPGRARAEARPIAPGCSRIYVLMCDYNRTYDAATWGASGRARMCSADDERDARRAALQDRPGWGRLGSGGMCSTLVERAETLPRAAIRSRSARGRGRRTDGGARRRRSPPGRRTAPRRASGRGGRSGGATS